MRSTAVRRAAVVVVAVVALVLLGRALGGDRSPPSGPSGSSYATQPLGVAAYASLLERDGHAVRRLREPLTETPPDPRWTVVLLDAPALDAPERDALVAFVRAGGRLVAGGTGVGPLAAALGVRGRIERLRRPSGLGAATPVGEAAGVGPLGPAREATFPLETGAEPIAATRDAVPRLAVVARDVGRGRAVLLADAGPLRNRGLGVEDAALLALQVAGPAARDVAFVESVHGYVPTTGLAALPRDWLVALGLLAAALVAYGLARLRRLGRPEEAVRDLGPPRVAYVDALAAALARTSDRADVARDVRDAARRRLERRGGAPVDAAPDALRASARRFGLGEQEADALADPAPELLAAGRAHAHLHDPAPSTPSEERT